MLYDIRHICAVLLFALCIALSLMADEIGSCDQYDLKCITKRFPTTMLRYSLVKDATSEEPYVDSVWITRGIEDTATIYLVTCTQPREWFDISSVPAGPCVCNARVGDCVMKRYVYVRHVTTTRNKDVIAPAQDTHSFAIKYFRNGQLQIRCHDKTYTVQGIETK